MPGSGAITHDPGNRGVVPAKPADITQQKPRQVSHMQSENQQAVRNNHSGSDGRPESAAGSPESARPDERAHNPSRFEPEAPGPATNRRTQMTKEARQGPFTDHRLTPENAALVVLDYQPSQVGAITSIGHDLLVDNIVSVAWRGPSPCRERCRPSTSSTARTRGSPRTTLNAWEDNEFRQAEATGRRKTISELERGRSRLRSWFTV